MSSAIPVTAIPMRHNAAMLVISLDAPPLAPHPRFRRDIPKNIMLIHIICIQKHGMMKYKTFSIVGRVNGVHSSSFCASVATTSQRGRKQRNERELEMKIALVRLFQSRVKWFMMARTVLPRRPSGRGAVSLTVVSPTAMVRGGAMVRNSWTRQVLHVIEEVLKELRSYEIFSPRSALNLGGC